MEPRPDNANRNGGLQPMPPSNQSADERERAARIANVAAHLAAERGSRAAPWADWKPR